MLSIDVPKVQQQHRSRVKGEGRFTQELPQDGPEENCRVISRPSPSGPDAYRLTCCSSDSEREIFFVRREYKLLSAAVASLRRRPPSLSGEPRAVDMWCASIRSTCPAVSHLPWCAVSRVDAPRRRRQRGVGEAGRVPRDRGRIEARRAIVNELPLR